MEIRQIIERIEKEGTWVDWQRTRDFILYGNAEKEVDKAGVCWVATKKVIKEAIEKDIHFIISHENLFYQCSTSPPAVLRKAVREKKALLDKGDITVYRCHDVWDKIPEYGVADQWAKRLGFSFERETGSYLQFARIAPMKVAKLAEHVAEALCQDGEDGVWVLGDLEKEVSCISMGTGAATDIFAMLERQTDVLIVSDDGITNYCEGQFALDVGIPMIVVNHAGCEICGIKSMKNYMQEVMPQLETTYLQEGYDFRYIIS